MNQKKLLLTDLVPVDLENTRKSTSVPKVSCYGKRIHLNLRFCEKMALDEHNRYVICESKSHPDKYLMGFYLDLNNIPDQLRKFSKELPSVTKNGITMNHSKFESMFYPSDSEKSIELWSEGDQTVQIQGVEFFVLDAKPKRTDTIHA